ncbi:MAG: hypothetical protein QOH36_2253 [Actinomycetota bacterium]|nr:hypothetical protein [Actinomycetota bacterium]
MQVGSDRAFAFAVGPAALWTALTSVERYRTWWPWLRRFDGESFVAGARWRCAVRAPLGYPVRFDVVLDEVAAGRSAAAVVTGDIAGHARLDVVATGGGGSELRLVSTLTSERWLLRAIARLAPPVARLGHDRLLDTGVRQFRAQAFTGEA